MWPRTTGGAATARGTPVVVAITSVALVVAVAAGWRRAPGGAPIRADRRSQFGIWKIELLLDAFAALMAVGWVDGSSRRGEVAF